MRTVTILLAVAPVFLLQQAPAADWRPVNASEAAQKTPRVDPGADAEAIFWDVRIEDRVSGGDLSLTMNHYIRIKIFTDRGREKYATVEIPRFGKRTISDVAGRTIKANGEIIEVQKNAIFDRELVKTKGLKLQGKTFTLPNVEPGDIIEYRYKEVRTGEIASHMRLYFQRDLPMWNVTYHLKPLSVPWLPFAMRTISFQCNLPPFQKESEGFYSTSLTNMPAFQEEPYMPPEDQLRAWLLIYYEEDKKIDPERFWKELGREDFYRYKQLMSANNLVKRTAAELTSGLEKPEDKLAALDKFCRTKITNLSSGAFRLTAEERKAFKESESAGSTLKQKGGYGIDVNLLFAAMANAAGFDARMARLPDRGDTFFSKKLPTTYFLNSLSVAVKVGDKWVFYDPATPYLEPGMLRWQEEGVSALISDPKEGFFEITQFSDAPRSLRQRRAAFKVLENGSLEGTVQYRYTGHVARARKELYEDRTAAQMEEDWKNDLQSRLSAAELSGFEITGIADADQPVVVRHKIVIPGYATRTGKRILLQPAFFQYNVEPRFTESQRKWDLYFEYGWTEDDEVIIDLPQGWELDQPVLPKSSKFGEVGSYLAEVLKTADGRSLVYRRKFEWGRSTKLLIPAASYPQIKKIFEFVQEQDNYTIALKAAADAK